MVNKDFYTTTEIAKLLGISRVAVFKRIKKGDIKAEKVGRNYVIAASELKRITQGVLDEKVTREQEVLLRAAMKRTIKDYGEALKLLGRE